MEANATRRRRRRRTAAASLVGVAASVAIATSVLWQRADTSRRNAEVQVRKREAAELLALGRLRLDDYPTGALAHAIASLERADNAPARRFAVEALWRGPTVHVLTDAAIPVGVDWSPDGRWLALGGTVGMALLDRETGRRIEIASVNEGSVGFSKDGTRLVTRQTSAAALHLWSIPEGKLLETWPRAERQTELLRDRRLLMFAFSEKTADCRSTAIIRERSIDGGPERTLGRWETRGLAGWGLDLSDEWLISLQGGRLLRQRFDALETPPRVLGRLEGDVSIRPGRWTDRIVTADSTGEVRVWSAITGQVERTLRSPASALSVALDPTARFLATAPGDALPPRSFVLFDLQAPRVAEPILLVQKEMDWLNSMAFHSQGQWLATGQSGSVLLWNLAGRRSEVLRGQKGVGIAVAFTPGRPRLDLRRGRAADWSLSPEANAPARTLVEEGRCWATSWTWTRRAG
jgi:WD40 repeat protein